MKLPITVRAAVIGLFISLVASGEAAAATYTFTKITDTKGQFSFFQSPSINNQGKVAFEAGLDTGGEGVFTGSGGPTTTIATTSDFPPSSSGPVVFSGPSINDSGTVAFIAAYQRLESPLFIGLFTGAGGSLTTIADSSGPYSSFYPGSPSINNLGKVAFNGAQSDEVNGIYTGSGGLISVIVNDFGRFANFSSFSINDSDKVAFAASLDDTSSGIFTRSSGPSPIITIANTEGPFRYFVGASINNEGAVAFRAGLQDQKSESIVIAKGGTFTTVAQSNITSSSSFVIFNSVPSINTVGGVAFEAYLSGNREGIFTGPNPVTNKVIASGDSLFGSTVTTVGFFQEGLNDAGQIGFVAQLADGTQVIVRADPVPVP